MLHIIPTTMPDQIDQDIDRLSRMIIAYRDKKAAETREEANKRRVEMLWGALAESFRSHE